VSGPRPTGQAPLAGTWYPAGYQPLAGRRP